MQTANLFATVRRPYLAREISIKKGKNTIKKWLVMFRDESGELYLLDSVPAALQFPNKRKKWLKDNKVTPAVFLMVEDGFFVPIQGDEIDDPTVVDTCLEFLADCNEGLGVAYLLQHGFVKEAVFEGQAANVLLTLGMSEQDAAEKSKFQWVKHMKPDALADARQILGLPDNYRAIAAATVDHRTEDPKPVDDKTVTVDASVVKESKQAVESRANTNGKVKTAAK